MNATDDTLDHILSLLPDVSRRLKSAAALHCDLVAVPVGQAKAMSYLFDHPVSSLSEVASGIGVTLATASELIERLVEAGHVERGVNPKDRRQVQLTLSPEAAAMSAEARGLQREQLRGVVSGLDPEDWLAFERGLTAVAAALRAAASKS